MKILGLPGTHPINCPDATGVSLSKIIFFLSPKPEATLNINQKSFDEKLASLMTLN